MSENLLDGRDIIDTREILERIEELKALWSDANEDANPDDFALSEDDWSLGLDEDEVREIVELIRFAKEDGPNFADFEHGETLIRDSYFEDYAKQLAEDLGAIDGEARWPLTCIDWTQAARELQMDYTSVELDGVTYWGRA